MAEETSQPAQPSVNVLAQYIRDLSFENILAQKGVSVMLHLIFKYR